MSATDTPCTHFIGYYGPPLPTRAILCRRAPWWTADHMRATLAAMGVGK